MEGWVRVALTREPSFFAACRLWGEEWAVLALEGETLVGMYRIAAQAVHFNGEAHRLGYLGGLRVSPEYRHRLGVLRAGYASVSGQRGDFQTIPDGWYSVIAADNRVARRLLEAHLPGLPRYTLCNEFVTLAISVARARRHALWQMVTTPQQLMDLCAFYNRQSRCYQFSPVLTPEAARHSGARFFATTRQNGEIAGCMALWNQQTCKQIHITGYRPPLAALLPLYNFWADRTRRVRLPPPGACLDQCYLAFFAIEEAERVPALIEDALSLTDARVLSFGLHAAHPTLPALLKKFRPIQYRSCLYAVSFDEPLPLDGRPAQPEAAVL
jgi:hypothetical protein